MACCMVALVMVYQLIEAWRRTRRVLGLPGRALRAAREQWLSPATPLRRRALLVAVVAIDLGLAGGLGWQHRDHLQRLHDYTRETWASFCRSGPARLPNDQREG